MGTEVTCSHVCCSVRERFVEGSYFYSCNRKIGDRRIHVGNQVESAGADPRPQVFDLIEAAMIRFRFPS